MINDCNRKKHLKQLSVSDKYLAMFQIYQLHFGLGFSLNIRFAISSSLLPTLSALS